MVKQHLQKRSTTFQVKTILRRYVEKTIKAKNAYTYLLLGRTQFYYWVSIYRSDPDNFSIDYARKTANRCIKKELKTTLLYELEREKTEIIDNPDVPTKRYNYSYLQGLLKQEYNYSIALSTLISIAKEYGYYKKRKRQKNKHTREVITTNIGELIQHDSSHHMFAPASGIKWYLITSLDDYSRKLLYANLVDTETTWKHIRAVESVCLKYGIPFSYYVDQHSVFRYVKNRDKYTIWTTYVKFTDDIDPQWKQVVKELSINPIYALSAQAKGKVERPYQWLQDHLVRTCVRENISDIKDARAILQKEVYAYNNKQVHSTTGEIPNIRFNKAVKEGKTLFRPFETPRPFISYKDIFCLRLSRRTNGYRKISVNNTIFKLKKADTYTLVEIRIRPYIKHNTAEVRFWSEGKLIDIQEVSLDRLPSVRF